jgi:hypothetical protein
LYDILSDHPDVCLSKEKEIDFFSYHFDFGHQWYEQQFPNQSDYLAVGEVSPSYFHGEEVPARVRDYDEAMRLIVFLRDPVQRAISNHKHEVRTGHLSGKDLSFEFGLQNNPQYLDQGCYATHLQRWLDFFPREQILVVLFDEIIADGASVARRIYQFLDIDVAHISAALEERSNPSYVNRSGSLEQGKNTIRTILRALQLGGIWEFFGKLGLRSAYRSVNRLDPGAVIPPLQSQTLDFLQEYFVDEINRLEGLAGLRLNAWRKPGKERAHG